MRCANALFDGRAAPAAARDAAAASGLRSTARSRFPAPAPSSPAPCCPGAVRVGDQVLVSPSGLEARVRSHPRAEPAEAERGEAGDRCALNLAGAASARRRSRAATWSLDPSAARAGRPHRRRACALLPSEPKAMRPMDAGAPASCGRRSRRAHRAARRRADRAGQRGARAARARPSDRRGGAATASCCATPPPSARSAAVAFSTCARPRASAARPSGWRSLPRTRSPTRKRRFAALLRRRLSSSTCAIFARDRALAAAADRAARRNAWRVHLESAPSHARRSPAARWRRLHRRSARRARRIPRRESRSCRGWARATSPRARSRACRAGLRRCAAKAWRATARVVARRRLGRGLAHAGRGLRKADEAAGARSLRCSAARSAFVRRACATSQVETAARRARGQTHPETRKSRRMGGRGRP